MKSLLVAVALVLSLTACKKDAAAPAAPVDNAGTSEPPVAGGGSCAADTDCVVTCARPQECCDQLCAPCEQVMTTAELAAHEAWRGPACAAETCPVARCMAPKDETFARCEAGQCVIDRRPVSAE